MRMERSQAVDRIDDAVHGSVRTAESRDIAGGPPSRWENGCRLEPMTSSPTAMHPRIQ